MDGDGSDGGSCGPHVHSYCFVTFSWRRELSTRRHGTFPRRALFSKDTIGDDFMDKDRIKGSAKQAKGKVKEVAGKATGDKKVEAEGKTEKTAGKVRNAVGGLKDAVRRR